jgi:DNA replication and repair protein RecF
MIPASHSVHLARLSLRDFRNVADAEFDVPREGAVVVGDNGQGKTNLLEAMAYVGTLRSIRNARDRDLVRHDAVAFSLHAAVAGGGARDIVIGVERTTGRKRVSLDGVVATRQVDALGTLPAVAWSPADVALVAGGPGDRRRFLDIMLALSSRPYLHALRLYRAALERRNATIRTAQRTGRGGDAIAAWEPALAEHGAVLVATRRAWTTARASEFTRLCDAMGEPGTTLLRYDSDAGDAPDSLADKLRSERERDLQRGMTCVGPHRDDMTIAIDGRDARTFGSAGQQRTAAIALRLLEARTLRAESGSHPVLLLDDPFAELDAARTERALALFVSEQPGQVVLAVPRADQIPPEFQRLARWRVEGGVVSA